MRLLLLLLLSITNIFAQEKVLGVDIPKDFIVEYNKSKNIHHIYSSNVKEIQEKNQEKGVLEDSYLMGTIAVIGDTNIILFIYTIFWKDPEYQDKSEKFTNAMFYIKNNDKTLKKEMLVYLVGKSNFSMLKILDTPAELILIYLLLSIT